MQLLTNHTCWLLYLWSDKLAIALAALASMSTMQDHNSLFAFATVGATATPAGCPGRAVTTTGKADNHSLLAL